MKIADTDIVVVPGYTGADPGHWQSRWLERMPTARLVRQDDWHKPEREEWVGKLLASLRDDDRPAVLVAHSLGCQLVTQAAASFDERLKRKVRGAFLVAPPDVENPAIRPRHLMTFGPYPRERLPFPSIVLASRNDEFCAYEKAEEMASAWGSLLIDARDSGHINTASGHGPWPDGLMVFANFMSRLKLPH